MIIEFIGTPGAGKTTLMPTVIEFFQEQGMNTFTVAEAVRPFAMRTIPGKIVSRLAPPSLYRLLFWQVFYRFSVLYRVKFWLKHPRLMRYVLHSQKQRPPAADVRQRKVLFWFFRLLGYYEFLKARQRTNEVLLFDEGFVHRVVQLFSSSVEMPQQEQLDRYLARLPRPDLVIFAQASPEVCEKRIYDRGLWQRAQHKDPIEISHFVLHAHQAVNLAVHHMKSAGWSLIEVDNDSDDLAATKAALCRQLTQVFASVDEVIRLQAM